MSDSNWTLRFPRTTRCDGHAIYYYKTPAHRRFFYVFMRRGWLLVPVVLAVIFLAGCQKAAESSSAAGIEFRVVRLFTHDGCTVYRFTDSGSRYFVRCEGAASSGSSWQESCGKGCTKSMSVPTTRIKEQP